MWVLRWSIIGAIVLTLLAMIMINTEPVEIQMYGLKPIKIPIYLLLYSFFSVGMILIAVSHKIHHQLELYWSRKQFSGLQRELDWSQKELMRLYNECDKYRKEIWRLGGDPDKIRTESFLNSSEKGGLLAKKDKDKNSQKEAEKEELS